MGFFRPTYAKINLENLRHNFTLVKSLTKDSCKVMAMVKADAYGHGAVKVSKALEDLGVDSFGVATVEEGLDLREGGITFPIIVMGGLMGMGEAAARAMIENKLTPVIHSLNVLDILNNAGQKANSITNIHLKIDTGMSRLGVLPKDLDILLNRLAMCKNVFLQGVMTHFAYASESEYTDKQIKTFLDAASIVQDKFRDVHIWHTANSAAIIEGKFDTLDNAETWVRPGLMLYGSYPEERYRQKVELKPVMSIYSKIVLTKVVPSGTKISYNCTYTTSKTTRLGVVPIGYADGLPWRLSNKGFVLVDGRRVPIIGRVTMDMIMVDLMDTNARVGDEIVILGAQKNESITVEELSNLAGTISYEFFCDISKRMPRVYE